MFGNVRLLSEMLQVVHLTAYTAMAYLMQVVCLMLPIGILTVLVFGEVLFTIRLVMVISESLTEQLLNTQVMPVVFHGVEEEYVQHHKLITIKTKLQNEY